MRRVNTRPLYWENLPAVQLSLSDSTFPMTYQTQINQWARRANILNILNRRVNTATLYLENLHAVQQSLSNSTFTETGQPMSKKGKHTHEDGQLKSSILGESYLLSSRLSPTPHSLWHTIHRPTNEQEEQTYSWGGPTQEHYTGRTGLSFEAGELVGADEPLWANEQVLPVNKKKSDTCTIHMENNFGKKTFSSIDHIHMFNGMAALVFFRHVDYSIWHKRGLTLFNWFHGILEKLKSSPGQLLLA